MNKRLHRIVFNAARGLRMVVQESARSTGKGASGATSAAVSVGALAAALMSAPLHAQIVADPGAPGRQRPTLLAAPNGVPLVNIQTPSAAGVSRNTYSQFDVNAKGVILNISRTNAQTQLGGWVQGNPWLAGGGARVILNEVNSANPSQLRGYVEVAGQRAEVIIANPAGIQVNGGGFLNASRATLTTGTPQFNAHGGLDSFLVRGGTVNIEGTGLDASKTDYAAILARAVQLNAGVWANELKVVAGANQVTVDGSAQAPVAPTGPTPSFALDVAALGGMYAGKITLIGTEAGLGVRNAGHIGAGVGGLVVTAAGRLENIGKHGGSISARQRLDIGAGRIENRNGALIFSAGDLAIGGALDADRHATGRTGELSNHAATIEALGRVDIGATQLHNTNGGVTWTMEQGPRTHVVEYAVPGSAQRWKAEDVLFILGGYTGIANSAFTTIAAPSPYVPGDNPDYRLLLTSPDYPLAKFRPYYAKSPQNSADASYVQCFGGDSDYCETVKQPGAWYGIGDPIWADFGVTPPAVELPAGHPARIDPNIIVGQAGIVVQVGDPGGMVDVLQPFDHPVTQAEYDQWQAYR
ncbi:hypothetical protein A9977_19795 [Variovorax sp. UMC13]|nr:hypothetical protein [Variovorax sp. UMC13]